MLYHFWKILLLSGYYQGVIVAAEWELATIIFPIQERNTSTIQSTPSAIYFNRVELMEWKLG